MNRIINIIALPISGSCHSPDLHSSSVSPVPSQAILLSMRVYFQCTTVDPVVAVRTGVSGSIKMTECEALLSLCL